MVGHEEECLEPAEHRTESLELTAFLEVRLNLIYKLS